MTFPRVCALLYQRNLIACWMHLSVCVYNNSRSNEWIFLMLFYVFRALPNKEMMKDWERSKFWMEEKSQIFKGPIFNGFGSLVDITPKVISSPS